ncbi:MAG: hypothetical protein ACFFB3_10885 [Candidatus Hodarchaeota archaeon]
MSVRKKFWNSSLILNVPCDRFQTLKDLAEVYGVLGYRRGDKCKRENTHSLYYYPIQQENDITASAAGVQT